MSTTVRPLRPSEVIDLQFDLHFFWTLEIGKAYAERFINDKIAKLASDKSKSWLDGIPAPQYAEVQSYALAHGNAFYVTTDMVDLIDHAKDSMPSQPLRDDDLPDACGFMYLERPIYVLDINGREYPLRAFSWNKVLDPSGVGQGVLLSTYVSARDTPDNPGTLAMRDLIEKEGRFIPDLTVLHLDVLPYGRAFTPDDLIYSEEDRVRALSTEVWEESQRTGVGAICFVVAAWAIMQQRITAQYREKPTRPQARRWKRRDVQPKELIVITLRRTESPNEGDEHGFVQWSHRWFVNGHWRKITHPRTGEQRAVYVSPHIKGPEDKPLIYKSRVYRVSR